MSITTPHREHPLLAAVRTAGVALDEATGVDPLFASIGDQKALLVELTRLSARVTALRAQVLAVGGDLALESGARTAGAWLAVETRTSRREAAHDEHLGVALRERWPAVAERSAGRITWEQTAVLVRSLDELPADLDPELRAKAEAHLLGEAGHFDPKALRRLGHGLLEVIAPDVADQHEARALRRRRPGPGPRPGCRSGPAATGPPTSTPGSPTTWRPGCGRTWTPTPHPAGLALDSDVDRLPLTRRRGEAFCALLEHIPADGLPAHGGTATSVMVTIDLAHPQNDLGLGLAETSTGDIITAAEARRLACTAGILPVVLGGRSEILDLGRTRRLFSPAQRKALAIRDRHCRAEGCDIPAAWCEAHHATKPWSQRRQDRPRRRPPALHLPPPPRPRPHLRPTTTPHRWGPLHEAQVTDGVRWS